MKGLEEIRKKAEKNGIKIPKQIRSKESIVKYLQARKSILRITVLALEQKIKERKKLIEAIDDLIKELEKL
jgi:hypothetical protein